MSRRLAMIILLGSCVTAGVVTLDAQAAGQVDLYQFDNDEQKRRYKALIEEFRCPKCLNTNIAGSDAPIAQDLRRTVHKLVVSEGLSDQEVRDFLQQRYGDFVLYNPPFNTRTVVIWLMPLVLALLGSIVLWVLLKRARTKPSATLDASDQDRLRALLKDR